MREYQLESDASKSELTITSNVDASLHCRPLHCLHNLSVLPLLPSMACLSSPSLPSMVCTALPSAALHNLHCPPLCCLNGLHCPPLRCLHSMSVLCSTTFLVCLKVLKSFSKSNHRLMINCQACILRDHDHVYSVAKLSECDQRPLMISDMMGNPDCSIVLKLYSRVASIASYS